MGTSAAADAPSERAAKLRARKRELETLLAAKNEELYRLCVQEVKLTGVMPAEAPPSPRRSEPDAARRPAAAVAAVAAVAAAAMTTTGAAHRRHGRHLAFSRHHTLAADRVERLAFAPDCTDTRNLMRVRETRFSSSHPDIATQYTRALIASEPLPPPPPPHDDDATPLIYRYASQLKARSPHLSGLPQVAPQPTRKRTDVGRRVPLQRTQTYRSPSPNEYARYEERVAEAARRQRAPDPRPKQKDWYESSLDSPSEPLAPREAFGSPRKLPQPPPPSPPRRASIDDCNANPEFLPSSSHTIVSPLRQQIAASVPFESPKNCTVIESGKWIPYREVTKPFEMSDFYKYSTKFRQNGGTRRPEVTIPSQNFEPRPDVDQPYRDVQNCYR